MEIKECAYISFETLIGTHKEKGTCNLFYEEENKGKLSYRFKFKPCDSISVEQCPYKLFQVGKIDKEELNKKILNILNEKGAIEK